MSDCVRKYVERQVYKIAGVYCPIRGYNWVKLVVCIKCPHYWGCNVKAHGETINCEKGG